MLICVEFNLIYFRFDFVIFRRVEGAQVEIYGAQGNRICSTVAAMPPITLQVKYIRYYLFHFCSFSFLSFFLSNEEAF